MSSELMLFGVRIDVDPMRKTASMNNLADYQHVADFGKRLENPAAKAGGYVSGDVGSARARDRKRGTPWSEEEHKRFLMGLKNVGKGDWRGISKNFVKTRTPTQVASHAQKYFLRHNTVKRRRRSSLFDITTEMVSGKPASEQKETAQRENAPSRPNPPAPSSSNSAVYPMIPVQTISPQLPSLLVSPIPFAYPLESTLQSQVALQPVPPLTSNSPLKHSPLSLDLSLSLFGESPSSLNPAHQVQTMPGFITQDSYISVA